MKRPPLPSQADIDARLDAELLLLARRLVRVVRREIDRERRNVLLWALRFHLNELCTADCRKGALEEAPILGRGRESREGGWQSDEDRVAFQGREWQRKRKVFDRKAG